MKLLTQATHSFNGINYSKTLTKYENILEYLEENSMDYSNFPFITELNPDGSTSTITYKDFYEMHLQLSKYLIKKLNIYPGMKIAILPKNDLESILTIIALLKAGATVVILNPNEPKKRINEQLETANCDYLFYNRNMNFEVSINSFDINIVLTESLLTEFLNVTLPKIESKYSPAIIMFTTGTTSSSKAVMQSNYNIVVNCTGLINHHKLNNSKTLLCTLPIFYANGLEFTIFSTMMAGSHVVLLSEFNPILLPRIIKKFKVNIASMVPNMLNLLLEIHDKFDDFDSLDYFVTAAAPLSQETSKNVYKKMKKRIIQGYGLTETTNFSTLLPINLNEKNYIKWMIENDIPTVGAEIFGNEVAILNPNGEVMPLNEEGEIVMRGHNVMLGYLNNQTATDDAFNGGWFHSGDLGKLIYDDTSRKKMLIITGRLKNIIKIGGQGVSLDEIDRIVTKIQGVKDSASIGLSNHLLGETLGILVSLYNENNLLFKDKIENELKENLALSKLTANIQFIKDIPRSPNGKLNRNNLKKYFAEE